MNRTCHREHDQRVYEAKCNPRHTETHACCLLLTMQLVSCIHIQLCYFYLSQLMTYFKQRIRVTTPLSSVKAEDSGKIQKNAAVSIVTLIFKGIIEMRWGCSWRFVLATSA